MPPLGIGILFMIKRLFPIIIVSFHADVPQNKHSLTLQMSCAYISR